MSGVVWANILLAIPFLIAFIGIPLRLTFQRPKTSPAPGVTPAGRPAGTRERRRSPASERRVAPAGEN